MVDRIPEDSPETGPIVRPYIQADPRYATAADGFWSQRRPDESTPRSGPPAAGDAPGGDLLSTDWTPERGHAGHGAYDQDDEPAGHDDRETGTDIPDRQPYVYEDEAADSTGFLGSGWRRDEPEEFEERRRGGVLLRVGGVGVAVAAAIWALSAWVGGPVESCTGECAAKAEVASSPAVSAESIGDSAAEPVPTTGATPARSPSPAVRQRTAPTSAPAVTPTQQVVPTQKATPARRSSAPRPTPTTASRRPAVVDPQRNEKPVTPSDQPTATSEPTPAPAPTRTPEERGRGGLLDWLL